MSKPNLDFRERLMAAQTQDEQLKTHYQEKVRAMLEHKLNKPTKLVLIALTIFCLFGVMVTVISLPHLLSESVPSAELGVIGLAFELAMAACLSWIIWHGSLNRAAHGFVLAGIAGVGSLFIAACIGDFVSMPGWPERIGRQAVAMAIATLVIGWLPMVLVTVSYYHNRTREKLLEIQYQLAELAEQINRRP